MSQNTQQLTEGVEVLKRVEHLVRMGLMPIHQLPLLKMAFANMEKDIYLPLNQRAIFYEFVTELLNLSLGDETINRLIKQKTAMKRYEQVEHNIEEGVDLKKAAPGMLIAYSNLVRKKLKNGLQPTKLDRDMVAKAKSELRRRRHAARKRAMMESYQAKVENAMAHFNVKNLQELPEDKVKEFFNYIESQGE